MLAATGVGGFAVGRLTAPTQSIEQTGLITSDQESKKEIQSDNLLAISIGNSIRQYLAPSLLTEFESGIVQVYTPALFRDVASIYRISRDKIEGPIEFRFACFDSNKCKYQSVPGTYLGVAQLPSEAYKPTGFSSVKGFFGITTLFILQENGEITEDKYLTDPKAVTMFNASVRRGKHAPELENSAEFYDITLKKPWKIVGDRAVELAGDLKTGVLLKDATRAGEPVALIEEIYPIAVLK